MHFQSFYPKSNIQNMSLCIWFVLFCYLLISVTLTERLNKLGPNLESLATHRCNGELGLQGLKLQSPKSLGTFDFGSLIAIVN